MSRYFIIFIRWFVSQIFLVYSKLFVCPTKIHAHHKYVHRLKWDLLANVSLKMKIYYRNTNKQQSESFQKNWNREHFECFKSQQIYNNDQAYTGQNVYFDSIYRQLKKKISIFNHCWKSLVIVACEHAKNVCKIFLFPIKRNETIRSV